MYRKISVISVLAFMAFAPCRSQILFDPPSHDFGEVHPGKNYVFKVKVTNSFKDSVALSSLSTNGASSSVSILDSHIAPNTSTWMILNLQPTRQERGLERLMAYVTYAHQGAKKGKIKVEELIYPFTSLVNPAYSFSPDKLTVSFEPGQKVSGVDGKLALDKGVYPDWKFGSSQSDIDGFSARVKLSSSAYSVHLDFPQDLRPGNYSGKLVLKGSSKTDPEFEYPYNIVVKSVWEVEPKSLALYVEGDKALSKWQCNMTLKRTDGKDFNLSYIKNLPSWLKYDFKKGPKGKGYFIQWHSDPEELERENVSPSTVNLVLETDSDVEKDVSIPLTGFPSRGFIGPLPTEKPLKIDDSKSRKSP